MALRALVEGECGAANPLVQWSTHFSQDKSVLKGSGLDQDRLRDVSGRAAMAEGMVDEFLGRPSAPQSFNVPTLLSSLQSPAPPTTTPPAQTHRVNEWVAEFRSHEPEPWAREFQQWRGDSWSSEFAEDQAAKQVAKEMTQTITDPQIQATEFMEYVRNMAGEETEWVKEFQEEQQSKGGFWNQLESEWNELSKKETHPWLQDYEEHQKPEYIFNEQNPLKNISNPLEEGLKRREEGDLPGAVLLFEAEVQARPDNVQGWLWLGITQADNEQDTHSIAALTKCLSLDGSSLEAHMALAVSYTNESQQTKALESLTAWLANNPRYSGLVKTIPRAQGPFAGSFMTREHHSAVRDMYIAAAQSSPDNIDYNVQVGLGVLFNLSSEYDKAVDCFTAALNLRPQDAMLWNKLGATLANGSRSDEAVAAYRKALEIMPGFTRCRYNLGVSCINLGAHKEAVEHLLTALHMQREARGPDGTRAAMSEGIWRTLRLPVTYTNPELNKLVDQKDLDGLLRAFKITV